MSEEQERRVVDLRDFSPDAVYTPLLCSRCNRLFPGTAEVVSAEDRAVSRCEPCRGEVFAQRRAGLTSA